MITAQQLHRIAILGVPMEIIGHRGAKGLAPENTVASIKRGLSCHVDMIEVDVRVDNKKLVLSHDPTVNTKNYTALEEALKVVNGKVKLNLEIKEIQVVEKLPSVMKHYKGDVLYSSFDFHILQELTRVLPHAEIAVLEKWSGVRAVAEASLLGIKRVHINQQWLWSGFVRSMKHRGYKLYAYTVNNSDRAEELKEWGVDGIFTDFPSLFKREDIS